MRLTMILIPLTVRAMYVCLCNGHRESDIRRATESGLRCVRAIYRELGGAPRCGRCLPVAESVVAAAVEATQAACPDRGAPALLAAAAE
jgi:bacterioferritin-associated ferredoxin